MAMPWPGQIHMAPRCNGCDPAISSLINVEIAMERCDRPLWVVSRPLQILLLAPGPPVPTQARRPTSNIIKASLTNKANQQAALTV